MNLCFIFQFSLPLRLVFTLQMYMIQLKTSAVRTVSPFLVGLSHFQPWVSPSTSTLSQKLPQHNCTCAHFLSDHSNNIYTNCIWVCTSVCVLVCLCDMMCMMCDSEAYLPPSYIICILLHRLSTGCQDHWCILRSIGSVCIHRVPLWWWGGRLGVAALADWHHTHLENEGYKCIMACGRVEASRSGCQFMMYRLIIKLANSTKSCWVTRLLRTW